MKRHRQPQKKSHKGGKKSACVSESMHLCTHVSIKKFDVKAARRNTQA